MSGASARVDSTRSSRSSRSSLEHPQVGPEAGGRDHRVGGDAALAVGEHQAPAALAHRPRLEAGDELDRAVGDQPAHRRAERAAGGQLVIAPAAVLAAGRAAADRPGDLRPRLGPAQGHEVEDRVEGGVARADDEDAPARVPVAVGAEDVRDPVGDPVGKAPLARCRHAARAERVRLRPGAGGVDHRAGQVAALRAALVDDQLERRVLAAGVLELVDPVLGDRLDARVEVQRGRDRLERGEGLEVPLGDLVSRGVGVGGGRLPARRGEQLPGDGVDVVRPRREDPDVTPLAHGRADGGAGFEDQRLQPARQQVRRGGEPDGTGADDGDGQRCGCWHERFLPRCEDIDGFRCDGADGSEIAGQTSSFFDMIAACPHRCP